MLTVEEMEYHPTAEKLVAVICDKVENNDPLFFRVLVGFSFCKIAASMRASILTHDRGEIPISMFALNLATSGAGKGYSTNIMEQNVMMQFRKRYLEETFPIMAEANIPKLALNRANRKSTDPDLELEMVQKEFDALGQLPFDFATATVAAVRQARHQLLMANAGAVNLQIDEIGANLIGNKDTFDIFLELYDVGLIKQALRLNTKENKRSEEIVGRTPTNLMMFGTPSKLLDGGLTETELYSMLEMGYARRCFFGYSSTPSKKNKRTPEDIYNRLTDKSSDLYLQTLADKLENLADIINANKKLVMTKETSLILIEYKQNCEAKAEDYPEHEGMKKAEMSHRYFKALKLAGAYAYIDDSPELTTAHLYNAIKLAEECGNSFNKLLTRDKNWVKLAKYIANVRREVTQADLVEELPFYKGGAAAKTEMLSLAIAYGYKNNIIIKKSFSDGIEFLRGETLQATDFSKMILSYSTDFTTDYRAETPAFDQLHRLTQAPGMHWVSHHLAGGYRNEENCQPGFNIAVIDVDGGIQLAAVRELLKNYKYLIYTTKRHTEAVNRFRILMPLNYELKLDAKDYKEFMGNLFQWLPFEVDKGTDQRSKKWMSNAGHYEYNEGELLDALPFIPKTSKNEDRKNLMKSQQSMDNLERWTINNIGDGNRNNMLLRFAMVLVDCGCDMYTIRARVMALNDKIADKLEEIEIVSTILVSVGKAVAKRPAADIYEDSIADEEDALM